MDIDANPRITTEPDKCGGRPCIRGTRIRVTDVLSLLGAGASFDEVLSDYPNLEADDILAALNYAAAQVDRTGLTPLWIVWLSVVWPSLGLQAVQIFEQGKDAGACVSLRVVRHIEVVLGSRHLVFTPPHRHLA